MPQEPADGPPDLTLTDDSPASPHASDDVGHVGVGALLGRYRITERIGQGGMGVVFAAHDPELDRTVAVKLLRPDGLRSSEQELRLRREGQVMAKLSHPNVIRVYDVGVAFGSVFVAMEFVDGGTLRSWLDEAPRTREEILAAYTQAGRGLAASHDAGLVHRDFKPSNVLVGKDGRVLVTDFGIARSSPDGVEAGDAGRISGTRLFETITRAAGPVGTPAYMAPEQYEGRAVDARADQFSFCVSLWRSICGSPPFIGDSWEQLATATAAGKLAEPQPGVRIPVHVRRALERGLRPDPIARFGSMHELLAALSDDALRRRGRRWRTTLALAAVLAAGFGAAWLLVGREAPGDPCAARVDRFAGVWDDDARTLVETSFNATGLPYAQASAREVIRLLDLRRFEWEAMRRDSCEDTRIRREQSDAAMDLRAACLERRFAELAALVATLRRADAKAVEGAVPAVVGAGDVADCGDAAVLGRRAPLPPEPGRRAEIAELERALAVARAEVEIGHAKDMKEGSDRLLERSRTVGFSPTHAQALWLAARVAEDADRSAEAERLYEEALLAAEAGGDDALRFDIELRLIRLDGFVLGRDADAQAHGKRADALLQRLGSDRRRAAGLARARAINDWWHGRYADARREAERSVEILETVDKEGVELARALHVLGIVLQDLRESQASLEVTQRSLAVADAAVGPGHPLSARIWQTLGGTLRHLDRLDEAERALAAGLAIYEATYGPNSSHVAGGLMNLANLQRDQGKVEESIATSRRAVQAYESSAGPDSARTADALANLGGALSSEGRYEEAEPILLRAQAIHRAKLGADNPVTADSARRLGEHYLRTGRREQALEQYVEAVRAMEASQGKDSNLLVKPLVGLGEVYLSLGRAVRAILVLEHALAILDAGASGQRARVEFALARALHASHGDHARAVKLANAARERYIADGKDGLQDVARIDAWLVGRR